MRLSEKDCNLIKQTCREVFGADIRKLRNEIAPEYSQNVDEIVQALNANFEESNLIENLHAIIHAIIRIIRERIKIDK